MKTLFFIVILLISSILFSLFNDKVNDISKPYLAQFIASQIDKNITIKIDKYQLDYNHIILKGKVNEVIDIDIDGDLNLLSQSFDLNYTIVWKEQDIDLKGQAEGIIENIIINGSGDAFDSDVHYALELENQKPQNIQVNIKDAQVEKVLALASKPTYAKGLFDLKIDMPKINQNEGVGEARLTLHQIQPNIKLLKNDFDIELPSTTLTGNIYSELNGVTASIDGEIQSNLAKLHLQKGHINLETMALFVGFILDINKLKKLHTLTKSNLKGRVKFEGELQKDNEHFQIGIKSKSLGGNTQLTMLDNKLNVDMQGVALEKVLNLLNQPIYLKGELDSKIELKDLNHLNGMVTLATHNAKIVNQVVNQTFDLHLQKPLNIKINTDAIIKNNKVHGKTTITNRMFNLIVENMIYNLKALTLNAPYRFMVSDLAQLQEITNRPLRGSLEVQGTLQQTKTLKIVGTTESFEGLIDFTLLDKNLHANIKRVPLKNLFYTFQYPLIFSAPLSGVLEYNLERKKGQFSSSLPNAKLIPNQLTSLIKELTFVDLTKEVYNKTNFDATLEDDIVHFNVSAKSRHNYISLLDAKFNKSKENINALYQVSIGKKDVEGRIKGDIHKPSVTIEDSSFLKEKVEGKVKEYMKKEGEQKLKDTFKDLGLDVNQSQEVIDQAKDFFKGLF